jgi:Penicillin-insensitive murein endopeptidase
MLLRFLFVVVLGAGLAGGAAHLASVARAGIELAKPGGTPPAVGRDDALVFQLRFADRDVQAAVDGRSITARRRGDLVYLRPGRLRAGAHVATVRARTPGPLARTVERRVRFLVEGRLDASAPRVRLRLPAVWHSPSHPLTVRIGDATAVRLALRIDGRRGPTSPPAAKLERILRTGPLGVGRHRLELRAVDSAGNARVLRRTVTVVSPERIAWRRSQASGTPNGGRLHAGVRLPEWGLDHFTWDPVGDRRPNPPDRRWGTDRLVRTVLDVLRAHRSANPGAPPVGIGDLSPPGGGPFASGGHLSHQNGLDVDVYYPRRDRRLRAPTSLEQVDRALAQDLVTRFVSAGAQYVFVDTRLGLEGPSGVVQHWPNHEDHLHVRLTVD